MMPGDDYASTGGGSLKLKGVNASSKIAKKKKKKRPKSPESSERAIQSTKQTDEDQAGGASKTGNNAVAQRDADAQSPIEDDVSAHNRGKTEAELRHEERRRRRLDERLKREGTKTHKERVEELNRYLSNLSEHHDMPRIGPG